MDLISREAMMKQLDFNLKHMEKQYHTILRCIYRQMADLPVIEIRPKGKWVDGKCSECGFEPMIKPIMIDLTSEPRIKNTYNFCSNCGADMG